jgi:hypothetical protein
VLHATTYVRECNYFQNIENGLDPVHTAIPPPEKYVDQSYLRKALQA